MNFKENFFGTNMSEKDDEQFRVKLFLQFEENHIINVLKIRNFAR